MSAMSHPLLLALFDVAPDAVAAARAVRAAGVAADQLSIVSRNHDEEGALAELADATPGSEIEDSRRAGRLGELSAHVVAAVALVVPGVGPLLASGPLAAKVGEAAGHLAGGLPAMLVGSGIDEVQAERWQSRINEGAVLVGVHTTDGDKERVREILNGYGPRDLAIARWP
jgi:hypothetical protein